MKDEARNSTDQVHSENVQLINSHVIRMKYIVPVPGKPAYLDIDLSKFYLPPTPFKPSVTLISSRPEYVKTIYEVICAYVDRNGYGDRTPTTVRGLVSTLVKFFEYLWMKGCFRLVDCMPADIESLPRQLAEGGWAKALEIDRRAREFLRDLPSERIRKYLHESKKSLPQQGHQPTLATQLIIDLGTNISGQERSALRATVMELAALPKSSTQTAPSKSGMSFVGLCREFTNLNSLSDEIGTSALPFVPVPNATKFAKKYGRPNGRTRSLKPQEVGALLKESFWTLDVLGPVVADVLDEYHSKIEHTNNQKGRLTSRDSRKALEMAIERSNIKEIVGKPVAATNRMSEENASFGGLIRSVMSAAFVVIAMLNGRRRGEVENPVYGLSEGALKLVDEQLGIYECRFYIEKTIRDYVWFYVGDATARAIRVLERFSRTTRKILQLLDPGLPHHDELDRLKSLFQRPTIFTKAAECRPSWFVFGMSEDSGLIDVLGAERRIAPHMFRRAYALVFFYRYEDGDLLALKQQLGHFDVEMTRSYVTWAAQKSLGESMADYGKIPHQLRQGLANDARAMALELDAVSKERIREFVEDILMQKGGVTGGFAKLILRFHQRWSGRIEYNLKTQVQQTDVLTALVIERGHSVTPFPHGNCVVSEKKKNSAAGCYSHEQDGLLRERAGPNVCSRCPYHILGTAHLAGLREDALRLEAEMNIESPRTVMTQSRSINLDNLKRLIQLYESRLTQVAN